jgi:hypothetical protein
VVEGSELTLGLTLGVRVGASVGCTVGLKIQLDGVFTVCLVIQEASFPALSVAVTFTSKTVCTLDTVLAPAGGYWVLVNVLQSFATIAPVKDGIRFGISPFGHDVKVVSLAGGQTIISGGVVSFTLLTVWTWNFPRAWKSQAGFSTTVVDDGRIW